MNRAFIRLGLIGVAAGLAVAATNSPAAAGFLCARPANAAGSWLDARYEAATAFRFDFAEDGYTAGPPSVSVFAGPFDPPLGSSEVALEYVAAAGPGPTTMLQEIFVRVYLLQKFAGGATEPPGFDPPGPTGGDSQARDATTSMPGPSGLVLLAAAAPIVGGYFVRRKRPAA
jgi:hypothetical protein